MKKIFIVLSLVLVFALGACTTTTSPIETTTQQQTTAEQTTTVEQTTTTEEVVEANPLLDNLFELNFTYDSNAINSFVHFYENGVFYYFKTNGAGKYIGYYEVLTDGPYVVDSYGPDHGADPLPDLDITVDQKIIFYTMDGEEIGVAGFDAEELILYGFFYDGGGGFDFVVPETSLIAPGSEVGQIVIQYNVDGDEYSELLLLHDGTYTDTVGLFIEGTWTVDGNVYTLTPTEGDSYTVTVSVDGTSAEYVNGTTTATLVPPVQAEPVLTLYGEDDLGTTSVTLVLFDDESAILTLVTPTYDVDVNGTYEIDGTSGEYTVTVGDSTYTFTPDTSGNISFDMDASGVTVTVEYNAGPAVLYSFESADETKSLTFYESGLYVFEYTTYSIVEIGTFAFAGYGLTITQSNGNIITGVMDGTSHAFTIDYVCVASSQITATFTVDAVTWGTPLTEGSYVPVLTNEIVLYGFESGDETKSLTFYANGLYVFEYTTYGIVEIGTFAFAGYGLTITQANGNIITGVMDATSHAFTIDYVCVASSQITATFTVDAVTWGTPLTEGAYIYQ